MTERLCKDCDGLLVEVAVEVAAPMAADETHEGDLELMCVLCGAALTLGGMFLGECEALQELAG